MNKTAFLAIWAVALSCAGQTAPDVPPGNPTQFPKGAALWTIDVTYRSAPKPAKPGGAPPNQHAYFKQIEITQSAAGDVQRKIITFQDGKKTERWHFGSAQLSVVTDTPDGSPAPISDQNKLINMTILATGFDTAAFSWIDAANYQNTQTLKNKTCYHYKARVVEGSGNLSSEHNYEAWIDKKTLLPVCLLDQTKVGVFTFQDPPPAGVLTPPPAIADILDAYTSVPYPPPKKR